MYCVKGVLLSNCVGHNMRSFRTKALSFGIRLPVTRKVHTIQKKTLRHFKVVQINILSRKMIRQSEGANVTCLNTQCVITPTVAPVSLGEDIISKYTEITEIVTENASGTVSVTLDRKPWEIRTITRVPRTGLLIVGIAGNNGTTLVGTLLANKMNLSWETKEGLQHANWLGSFAMSATTRLGVDVKGNHVHVPIKSFLPMINPDHFVEAIGGWDISGYNLSEAAKRAKVLPIEVQKLLAEDFEKIPVMPGLFDADFVARNQGTRASNILLEENRQAQLHRLRQDIRNFRNNNNLENVVVVWSANTERYAVHDSAHETAESLMNAVAQDDRRLAPSLIYALASVLENCSFINTSPQNTFCEGLVDLAKEREVFLVGDDLKTGQTKFKCVISDLLISTGMRLKTLVSYNHLGNNDGYNLSADEQFKSKETSKSGVLEDMVASNSILYSTAEQKKVDHVVVIKYVPTVGDSKRALDEITADICMNGTQTLVVHNTCEDSLLAAPIMLDLILFTELFQRVYLVPPGGEIPIKMHPHLSLLSAFLKAPKGPEHAPIVNAFFEQKQALVDFLRAAIGLPVTNALRLNERISSRKF